MNYILEELQIFLESKIQGSDVVVMPDFFLDRLIHLDCHTKSFCRKLVEVVKRGGGSIDGISQMEFRGGNAINTASALAALRANVTPIVCTSKLGLKLMKFYLKPARIDLSLVKISNKASITTAMEFETKEGIINVMFRDVGALADFGSHMLNEQDFEVIENADYVCIFNWAGTRHFGTELAETVFHRVKDKGKGKTYYDTADPTTNENKISNLMKKILQTGQVDIFSINENEAIYYSSQLDSEMDNTRKPLRSGDSAKTGARILAAHLPSRIDLHAIDFSATFTKESETIIPSFKVPVLRVTGAGDAWNAGNILGDAHGLSDELRLALGNLVAAYYISNPKGTHATQKQLSQFCKKISTRLT